MTDLYPVTFASIPHWAREHNVRADLARMRFAQYAILRAISVTGALQSTLVFKGGNALDFVWQPNRSTTDLDFSIDETSQPFQDDTILAKFQPGLARVSRALQIDLTTHSVERRPPGADRTFATYQLKIGYVLPDEEALRRRVAKGEKSTHVIKLDISLNEPICASISVSIDGTHDLRVSTLEDIVAEKLRALLQQSIRNRSRCQDLLDIAVIVRSQPVDHDAVADYLLRKAAARNVPVFRTAFHAVDLATRANVGYAELEQTTRVSFIPFEEALRDLYELVDRLPIPDG
ncbi:MAG: nucleotidyl transferase AbiEii/AbiGii toxin family protein [Chloroflexia bacterium]|nr:nucleotidyl transferase AbiEii/AbiGii toxin family protein [Chloroflexia bacterium]